MSDDGMAGLNARTMVMHGWKLVLHGSVAGLEDYSDSVDAAAVSVSRARGALDKLDLRRRVYTCSVRVSDALLRVAARTKEDEGEWVLEMKARCPC